MTKTDSDQWIAEERERRRKDNPTATLFWEIAVALHIPHFVAWLNNRLTR